VRTTSLFIISACLLFSAASAQTYSDAGLPEAASLSFSQPAYPQSADIFKDRTFWAAGIHVGLLSGLGLSGRFHPPGRFAFQLTGGGIGVGEAVTYNFGGEAQFDFDSDGRSRFYGFLAASYYYWEDKAGEQDIGPFRTGLGIAYEWNIAEKLIFMANLGITYFSTGTVLPLPQAGFYYYFN